MGVADGRRVLEGAIAGLLASGDDDREEDDSETRVDVLSRRGPRDLVKDVNDCCVNVSIGKVSWFTSCRCEAIRGKSSFDKGRFYCGRNFLLEYTTKSAFTHYPGQRLAMRDVQSLSKKSSKNCRDSGGQQERIRGESGHNI